ncbi:hypothetical protein [Candidatus Sororendozoicomonas aggregata]|uniref:hypothetical protein n=1 Tax=Candidatus Sororendozoicomonas aggregata TaxID=3073239 RepID=UPI002ED02E33
MRDFYFTFKYGHSHFPGHIRITAEDQEAATALMNKNYSDQWYHCYDQLADIEPVECNEVGHITQTDSKASLLAKYSTRSPEENILYH